MNLKQIFACLAIGLLSIFFITGCATTRSKDASTQNDQGEVRVGGDITVSTVNRNGF